MPTVKKYQQQKEREQIAYQYFLNQGYSPEASAGIVGNLVYESGLNTKAEGDIGYQGGSSFGIAQFRGQRLKNLKNRYGDQWTDFNNQLDFVRHELETTHQKAGNRLKNSKDVFESGQVFSDLYEIPAKKYKNNPDRQKKVNSVYNSWSGKKFEPTPIADEAIRNVNAYFDSIPTTDVKDLEITVDNSNLAEEIEEENPEKDKDIEEVEKQTNEINFLQAYKDILNQQAIPQETVQTEQPAQQYQPQQNLTDIYNQVSEFIDSPIAQQGTVVRDNIPNLEPKIIRETNNLSPQSYLESYLQTPVYIERLRNQNYPNPEEVAQYRLDRLKDTEVYYQDPNDNYIQEAYRAMRGFENRNGLGSAYSPRTNKITINQEADKRNLAEKKFKPNKRSVEAHEFSHATTSTLPLNTKDEAELFSRLKGFQTDEDFRQVDKDDMIKKKTYNRLSHDFLPTENKADIDALRYELYKRNIYDTRKDGNFNKWHLNQIRNSDFVKNRLQNNYTDEDIIWLMNNIADNSNSDNTVYGQQGGTVGKSQEFLQNWYQNRVLPDPVLNETYQQEKPKYVEQSMYLPTPKYIDKIDDQGTQGVYDPATNEINILNTAQPLVYSHEASHKINEPLLNTQSSFNAFQYIGENITPRENIQNEWVKENYPEISNYREIIPRLNSYRQYYNLQPDQVITPELIQQNRAKYLSGEIPYEENTDQLYKLFEDANLADTLNKVVYTGDNRNTYAQQGVIKNQEGQRLFPNQVTEIQGNTMSTEGYGDIPLYVVPDIGQPRIIEPNTGEHIFENATKFTEYPLTENEKEFLKYISKRNG